MLRCKLSRTGLALAVFCAALIALIWTLTLERIAFEKAEAVRDTVRANSNLAMALEEHTVRTLKSVDHVLRTIKHDAEKSRSGLGAARLVAETDQFLDGVLIALGIADRSGTIVSTSAGETGVRIGDRDYFQLHRTVPHAGLIVGKAVLARGVGAGVSGIPVSRRIDRPDGSFNGVAVALLDPSFFSAFYARADLGKDGVIQLVGLDGAMRARRHRSGPFTERDFRGSTLFQELQKAPVGNFVSPGSSEGIPRYFSYRTLKDYPLAVAVGSAVHESLAGFHVRQGYYYLGASLAMIVTFLFAAGMALALHRQEKSALELRRGEARYRATFDQAAVGIAHTSPDCRFLRVNAKLCSMLDYPEEEILRRSFDEFTHPEDAGVTDEAKRRLLEGAAAAPLIEKRMLRKDGSVICVEAALSLVRNPDGSPDYFVSVVQDVTQRKQAEAQVLHQAHYDALTELPNRTLCYDRLTQALAQAQRKQWSSAVLFVNLDRFKQINDTLGHALGDRLLQLAAARLLHGVRAGDTVARIGGDEFVVVLAELASAQDAAGVAAKLIESMAAPFRIDGHEAFVTASIGVAAYPADGMDAETLLQHADVALLRAKQTGRGRYQFYAAEMNARALDKLLLENDLRRALEQNEFLLYFQPKVSLGSGRITGLEALLRWERPGNGLVSPAEFVPLLEQSGLIVPVGDWVVDAACAQLRAWQDSGVKVVPVAVNLSAKQLLHHDIARVIREALQRHRIAPELLDVEITESDAMENPQETARILRAFHEQRIRIAIDDFGTGYSSLSYLKRLPLDTLKLDRSFIVGLPDDAEDASISRAVVTLAHSLGLEVVAEGVETAAQRDFLAQQACDQMQGYLFSKPLPANECARLLHQELQSAA